MRTYSAHFQPGSAEAEGVLTEWATATQVKRENLLLRAFTRDQTGVKKEADKTLAGMTEQVAGTTEFTVMPATRWQSAIKGFVSAVKYGFSLANGCVTRPEQELS